MPVDLRSDTVTKPSDAMRRAMAEAEVGDDWYGDDPTVNAATAAGVEVLDFAGEVDAVMFALSKGLGAPIGSVLCGDAELVKEARRLKILFGGAWRQAGIMAAAGLVALDEGPKRLPE